MDDELIGLEDQGWQALRAGGGTVIAFYNSVLDTQVTMLLPGGLTITSRPAALKAMSGAPWDWYHLSDWAVQHVTDDVAVVTYSAAAERDETPYAALVSSLYVRRAGGWRLAFHQQTPR
ncbi:nuclear transport factor 2 family protein [Actinotalea fermentans]|uniref:DUF4440 domain-containing protein n=1 Tax=Actinotalea fermentans TaxID=43671 RepID=A0A511YZX0_9CELL|nr:nuclear transport factor 2 family protein [Actinotalea fermentans]KGM16878.1 hypothetical protein N867_14590 [Actinotalea fermentans ATCC 43279 = JCM 9966 = DSM 3133]GEN80735.1 hypothetical protein AFE02nite_24690 [Actinotalea fermentans]